MIKAISELREPLPKVTVLERQFAIEVAAKFDITWLTKLLARTKKDVLIRRVQVESLYNDYFSKVKRKVGLSLIHI